MNIDGVYFDSEDEENCLVFCDGTYFISHEHLTERGNYKEMGGAVELTIVEGDLEGAPPYQINIEKNSDSLVTILRDGKPAFNESGIFGYSTDEDVMAEYRDFKPPEPIELGDDRHPGAWMDDDAVAETIKEFNSSSNADDLLDYLRMFRNFGGCDWSPAIPKIEKLAAGKDKKIAKDAAKTLELIR